MFYFVFRQCNFQCICRTRKSSCVNARGIPPATYQVLHILSYPGGYPIPGWEVPHPGYPPILTWPGGTLPLDGGVGYPILGYPSPLFWPGQGVPYPWAGGREYPILGTPSPILTWPPIQEWGTPWKGNGTSHWSTPSQGPWTSHWGTPRTWDQWKYYGMEMGYPGCELTNKLKLLPSPSFGWGR